ncbi:hypothetical protein [Undibacterium sp. TS12]|uniref:hypothetical protein n=1 Tax=Undibacterium sp. TS12 TaxID=2908202 RepID=UPI001F4CC3A4|nr:hypothetical protein [Undibacterium sp. TS12]MCH8621568.1 hypothetical protein [Undibacterium sp. TS12]
MRKKTYYLASLLLPVILSLLTFTFAQFGTLRELSRFLVGAMIIGGIPYLLVLLMSGIVFFRLDEDKFVFYCHFSPFVMALTFGTCAAVMMIINNRSMDIADLFNVFIIGGLYSLLLGYAYVLLAAIIYKLLKSLKLIYTEPHRAFYE